MILQNQLILWFISLVRLILAVNAVNADESGVREFLGRLNQTSTEIAAKLVSAQWDFETDETENAKEKLFQITLETIENAKQRLQNVVKDYKWRSFSSPDIRRQLKRYSEIGILALSTGGYQQFQKIISDIDLVELNTTVCDYYNKTKCDLHLKPDIQEKLETSQNSGELSYLWTEWRKATEPQLKKLLTSYVELCNEAAKLNNYTDYKEYSLRNMESDNIREEMSALWNDIKPLYSQIHAYVRRKLRNVYGDEIVPAKGPIPAHLLGNIWSENWSGIADRMVPFPEHDKLNFTSLMISQEYTPEKVHRLAEEFLRSMNFSVPSNLWYNNSGKNPDTCHPKIFNFYNNDVRIKDCGKVSLEGYLEASSFLAKAEYMLQYSHQPFIYQSSPDPGLEEAVSDIITMSASTFKNLKDIGLYESEVTEEVRLNKLFKLALKKVTSIPFLLVQELSRWDVYTGKETDGTIINDLREQFQGISSFTKELSFDPGGPGSIFSKISLAHYFMDDFLKFQLYETLCHMPEGHDEKVFDECNLAHNADAGVALRNMMNLGSSKSLMETLSPVLGQTKINSKSLLKYFEPLMTWLTKENERTGEFIGWEDSANQSGELPHKKIRRKRSLEDYEPESKDDDSDNTPSREPDRFQRLIHKRSKDNVDESETSEREQKNAGNENNDKCMMKSKNAYGDEHKQRRRADDPMRRSFYSKKRRSLMKNTNSAKENSKDPAADDEKSNETPQKTNKFASKNSKRHSESFDQNYESSKPDSYGDRDESKYQTKNGEYETNDNYEDDGLGQENSKESTKVRYARKTRKQQRRFANEASSAQSHQIRRRKEPSQSQRQRSSRNAQWHTDSKKDISRLLHSFGFAVENDDKDKIKELKKKLKGDSNSDLKSNLAAKDSTYENMMDYNRVKSGEGRSENPEDKGTNKLWSVKSYMTDAKVLQSGSSLDKKDSIANPRLTGSMISHSSEEKSIGKKETSKNADASLASGKSNENSNSRLNQNGESSVHHLNIDVPSLQALLQKADLNSYGQKSVFTITPESGESKARSDMNQMYPAKNSQSKYGGNTFLYKYAPSGDMPQYKEKKEYKEDVDSGGKSPYIIILGQVSPDLRERLMQDKDTVFLDADKQTFQSEGYTENKKMSDKRSRASEQNIYIVPVDLKSSQHNLLKPNHYAEHEREAGHDPNTERDTESEEEQLHLEDNPKLDDKSNFYKTGKENPSEFIISWNNDKNRKIVKRSKREHKKEISDDKMKVVRIAPMKEAILEDLLGKSFDRANLDDKNVKILIQDSSLSPSSSMGSSPNLSPSGIDQFQTSAIHQPSSSLSSLASSVLSALSPKGYSQVKVTPHQESELDEETLKENGNGQATAKEQKEEELPFFNNPGLRCNALVGKKKGAKLYSDDDTKKIIDLDPSAKGDDACCKKIILTPCPPKCPPPCPGPCPLPCPLPCPCPPPCPCPCPCPCPDDCCKCPPICCKTCDPCCDPCCKKPSECSLVNCQFKITKAKKPHERLTIMIYDRINPPAELPEPYDALAVISEILQRIQCCPCKPCCQLTEEDPDYPANDNSDQLKATSNQQQDNKGKIQEISGEIPIMATDSSEEDEADDNGQNAQTSSGSSEEDKYQPKEKATPALDQLTVFNRDKLKPVFIELRKLDDLKKRSHRK